VDYLHWQLQIGSWDVEVDECIDPSSIQSGACFIAAANVPVTHAAASMPMGARPFKGHGLKRTLPPANFAPADPTQAPDGALVLVPAEQAPGGCAIYVDTFLARKLRPHQVEGVRFLHSVRPAFRHSFCSSVFATSAGLQQLEGISLRQRGCSRFRCARSIARSRLLIG
jgi:hypothetical protein